MNVNEIFSQQEIQEFKSKGYSDADIENAINEAQNTNNIQTSYLKSRQQAQTDPRASASNSFVASSYNNNLIQWQLELDSILERIEHMLRGDKPTWTQGNVIWKPPEENYLLKDNHIPDNLPPEENTIINLLNTKSGLPFREISNRTEIETVRLKKLLIRLEQQRIIEVDDGTILNDFGISEIMRILSNYINRNTILSNYDEDTIKEKLYDLGNDLADLIYLKYEKMGLRCLEKRKLYAIIVREMVDIVHSAYLRALNGGERESLREARQVSQTDTVMPNGVNVYANTQQKERGLLNPMRWIAGKYK